MENGTEREVESKMGVNLSSMRRMPEIPDMSGKLEPLRQGDPFALSDWGRGSVANTTKP